MSNIERLHLPKKPQKKIVKTKRPGIYQVIYPSGKVSWKAYAFGKGNKPITETFPKETQAINWKRKNENHAQEKRSFLTNKMFDRIRARELVEVYLYGGELNDRQLKGGIGVKGKPLGTTTIGYVKKFIAWLKANGDPSITDFDEDAASDYIEWRQRSMWTNKGWKHERKVLNSAIQREVNALRPIWNMARTTWRLKNLVNPFEKKGLTDTDNVKERRLRPGELSKLIEASSTAYGKHAIPE